ncbi:MAG: SDR family NAD(P)-dependent oxidoreductase, partial [Gammaproteobacteria bacterium]|nr:SDR family NAD(P)-dependent oxidoreductase [Gammaproteobacteria bacterium]
SSIYGNYPTIGAAVYGASKAAVDFLSESFRQETRGKIKVTVIKPTGVPATNLSSNIVNPEAPKGIWGHYLAEDGPRFEAMAAGQLPAAEQDPESPAYFALNPDYIVDAILHAIDQPLGVSVSSITVRATGDGYVL